MKNMVRLGKNLMVSRYALMEERVVPKVEIELTPEEALINSVYVPPADSYEPKDRIIKLRETRIKNNTSGRHEWRRNESSGKRVRVKTKPEINSKSGLDSLISEPFDSDSNFIETCDTYNSELEAKQYEHAVALLMRVGINIKVLEEYTPQEALEIQSYLDKEGLKLHDMIDLGKFILGTRSGKLYFIDHKVEALFGKERLTPEEFFNAEKIYDFQHFPSPHNAFTYVTWISGNTPRLKLGPTKKEYAEPLEHLLNGVYRSDPDDSNHRVEHLLSQMDKVRETKPN